MPHRFRALLAFFAVPSVLVAGCGDETPSQVRSGPPAPDVDAFLAAPTSCAYACPIATCAENKTPYACPGLGAWSKIPHLAACPAWDGTYPEPAKGKCAASAPTGDAIRRPGHDAQGTTTLPDGRISKPAGAVWTFDEPDLLAGITVSSAAVPGTPYVLTVDTGHRDHAVRAIDTSKIGAGNPVTGAVKFAPPSYLNSGIAFVPPGRVYVATDFGVIQALSFDPATGALSRDDAASLALPNPADKTFYTSGVAASPDGKHLVVSAVEDKRALVFDIDPASPTSRSLLGQVDIGASETFGVYFDPNDASGQFAYITVWGSKKVVELDLSTPTAPKVSRTFTTDKDPQGVAFLDARWMVVANDFGETLSLIDRVSGTVTAVPVDFDPGLRGLDVAGLAFDRTAKRLYAILAGINAITAYDVDLTQPTPKLTAAGRLPTAWWPSSILVQPNGALTVTSLRGGGIGPLDKSVTTDSGYTKMRGGVEQIPAPTAADLSAGEQAVRDAIAVGNRAGHPKLDCPAGVMDFPVPETNTAGPSKLIQHIFFIVRENKTFDSILGDLPGVEGDPKFTLKPSTAEMDQIWRNFRDLARKFTLSDNFYNLAVQSTQGHQWTTYGRASDFCERTWGANERSVPLCGIGEVGRPEEGSLFEWLQGNHVDYDILGEIVGNPKQVPARNPIDARYPGGPFQSIKYNDLEKACHTAGRARVACDLGTFVYMTLPNDHTVGVDPADPTPETMLSVNDEATGMVVDAVSHSPFWASSLIVLTEDDPQTGGDHIDYHRTPLILISPWVKRGYVSTTHIDAASLHKLFAHVLGLPYPNLVVKNAGLPLDMFTSTPDYTPYTYTPRTWPLACGDGASSAERKLTASWDFSRVDEQPGLGDQVVRWMRGKQLQTLPPDLAREVEARMARKQQGLPPVEEGDDDDDHDR